tara:strand:+ start:476 stop:583 length:108 start_codon:yes stop_codon:yes gene_type:complete
MSFPWTKELIVKQIRSGASRVVNNLAYKMLTHTGR